MKLLLICSEFEDSTYIIAEVNTTDGFASVVQLATDEDAETRIDLKLKRRVLQLRSSTRNEPRFASCVSFISLSFSFSESGLEILPDKCTGTSQRMAPLFRSTYEFSARLSSAWESR